MNNSFERHFCFAPKHHDCGYNDERFLTLAFKQGKVLSADDFAYEWQNNGGEQFLDYELRLLDLSKTCWEFCPECNSEVELLTKWEVQTCPECGRKIAPCNLCYPDYCDCKNCPLLKECKKENKERDDFWSFKEKFKFCAKKAIDELYDDRNAIDIRGFRYPYDPIKDTEIFPFSPLNVQAMWDFCKDAEEWYFDFYENFVGENYAEFMDIAVASWANE